VTDEKLPTPPWWFKVKPEHEPILRRWAKQDALFKEQLRRVLRGEKA
jgi:hypothetical protein